MSVPADQLPLPQGQTFTDDDFASAAQPAPAPTSAAPGTLTDADFDAAMGAPAPAPEKPSFLSAGKDHFLPTASEAAARNTKLNAAIKAMPQPGVTGSDIKNVGEVYGKEGISLANATADWLSKVPANLRDVYAKAAMDRINTKADSLKAQGKWNDDLAQAQDRAVHQYMLDRGKNAQTNADINEAMGFGETSKEFHKSAVEQANKTLSPAAAQATLGVANATYNLALMGITPGGGEQEGTEALAEIGDKLPWLKNTVRRVGSFISNEVPGAMQKGSLASANEGATTYHEVLENGGTPAQAARSGVTAAALQEAQILVPAGMRGQLLKRILVGAGYSGAISVPSTLAMNAVLPESMQAKVTPVSLAINAALGGAMAAIFGKNEISQEAVRAMYQKLGDTAANDPDPEKRASATRILAHATQFAHVSGASEQAILAASYGEEMRQRVMDAAPTDLYGSNDAYTRAYDAAAGQFKDDAQRVAYAKGVAASDTAMNEGWQQFMGLRHVIDDGLKDYQAAGQLPDLLVHAKNTLAPETLADLHDFLNSGQRIDPNDPAAAWLQTGASPAFARDTILRTMEGGKLPPEVQQTLDARRAREAQFAKLFPNINPETGEPLEPTTETPKPAQTGKPEAAAPTKQEAAQPARSPQDLLSSYFDQNPYPRSNEVLGYAAVVPPDLQQRMAEWSQNHSPIEVETAYREAATTGQLPAEVAINETQGRTEPAETAAEQNEAGHGSAQAETQPEIQEGVVGNGGQEPAGHEGGATGEGESGHGGNAEAGAGNAEAAAGPVTPRAAPVRAALADAGVAPEEAAVGPKGDIRIAQDASPEAAQKALDIAASDTGATNTEYPEPTPEQASAGNYRKGGVTFKSDEGDLRVKIENPDGSVRSGDWGSRPLKGVHYGYIPDTVSADGSPLDVLMTHDAHDPTRPIAFIRQHDTTTGKFDELKVVMGARSRNEALQAYWRQYPRDLHLKLTPNGSQDVVMMKRPKALAFIKSGSVDVPPHPVSGKPMLMLRQTVPVEFDSRTGNMAGTRDILDRLGKKHDLSGLAEDAGMYRGEVPRSAVPDLQHALEKNRVELEVQRSATGRPEVAGRVRENARVSTSESRDRVLTGRGRRAQKVPTKRSPVPEGVGFVRSSAPIFEEGVNGRIGAHPVSVVGIHYSPKEGLTELDPAEAGTGSAGGERRRFGMGNFGRSGDPMARVMSFYVKDSAAIPAKETVVGGSNKYETVLNNLYDVGADPDSIIANAQRDGHIMNSDRVLEEIRGAGYDGTVYPEPGPGQHARVATVRGVEGKIPVKELSEQYSLRRTPRKMAGELKRARDKFEEAAEQAKDEVKKRTKVPMFMLRDHVSGPATRVYLEMAPSPDFRSAYARFERLKPDTQKKVSDHVNEMWGPDAVLEDIFGKHAPTVTGWGGYLGKINPSMHVDYADDVPIKDVLTHAKDLADAYNQQSVMVLSQELPNKAAAIDIKFDGADDPATIKKLWTQLRAKTNDGVVGFSQIDGGISILNTDVKPEDAGPWLDRVRQALTDISSKDGVNYNVKVTQQGFDFIGGNYDRYMASLHGGNVGKLQERRISALQLASYEAIRDASRQGAELDRQAAKGLVAPGKTGVQVRSDSFRAVARLTRDKPSLADVADGHRQVAQVERAASADLKVHDEDGVPLPTPKGGPSKLTRDQWVMTRTPNFLRWGGDWLHDPKNADVLLDKETGEPQVFYHETDPRNEAPIMLQGFRHDLPGARFSDDRVPEGTFFKPQKEAIGVGWTPRSFKTQLPMFLRMRNPIEVSDKEGLIQKLGGDIAKNEAELQANVAENQEKYDAAVRYANNHPDDELAQAAAHQLGERIEESYEAPAEAAQKAIRAEMEARGYDGVIINNDHGTRGRKTETYITLRPNDSKSAGVTSGTFSERAAPMYRKKPFPDTGKRIADVKKSADALVSQFGSKPEVVVHENRASATPEAKAALDDVLGPDDPAPPAMYLDGKMHVFADRNTSPPQLEQAVMHEMVHYGLRKVFGPDMDALLDDIWQHAKNDAAFKETLAQYRNAYKGRPDFQRNVAEEYVAHLAETQSNPTAWRKVVDWFRAWGRKVGLVHNWTDDDIRHLIRSVYSDLKEGRTSVAGVPAARTTVDFEHGTQVTAYRGAAHGDFIEDTDGNWNFKNKDVDADLSRSIVDGSPALNADPKEITEQGVRDLASLAGEEKAVLTLPDSVPKRLIEASEIPFSTHDGMHVLRPEHTDSPMYALRNSAQADPDTQAIIDQKIGYDHAPTSPWEWMQSHLRNFHFDLLANDLKAYWLDAGAYVDLLERRLAKSGLLFDAVTSPYKMYWLSRNVRQIAMGVIRHGVPEWTPKGYNFRAGTKGLMDIWKPMMQTADGKNLMDLYGSYKIGVRAKRLLHEFNPDGTPKEKLFTEEEADKLIALGEKYPQFKTAFAQEQKFINELQDLAVERGALDPETAKAWQRNAYVPFRRIIDGELTPSDAERRGVSDKITSKRIRGAEYALKDPNKALVDNVIRLLDHVYNNDAKRRVMALGELSGAVKRLPLNWSPARVTVADAMNAMRKAGIEVDRAGLDPEDLRKVMTIFHPVAPRDSNIESTVEGGKLIYWQVNDGRLLKAIHDMRAINSALTDKFIKTVAKPAQWVRWGVTMSPKFMAKIMFKDAVNTWAQTGTNPNMLKHMWKNAARILTNDKFIDQLRINGFNGNEYYKVDDIKDYMNQVAPNRSILNSVKNAYKAYRRVGWVSEQLSRTRIAEHMLDRGASMAEAAWQGQNTLNWQKHGYGIAAKLMMRAVPFLNAHLQGMIRIYDGMVGRDVLANRNRAIMSFFIKSMAIAIPSMVLEAENQYNKDYQRLPDYIKDAYWNFYILGRHYMLPKPFEWGAMAGTMPQRALRVATGQDSSREFWKSVYDTLTNDVLMLPIPTAFQEPIEQFANKDLRTGLPIETEAMQQQRPADRYNGSTTLAAKTIGKTTNISPVRLQHFVNGYFASVGMYALQMMSGLMRATGHFPAKPDARGGSWLAEQLEAPFGGAKAANEPGNQYLSDFYDAQAVADQVAGSVRIQATRGEYGRAQELAQDNPLAFRGHHQLQVISVQLARLRKQQRMVESSPYLTGAQKRAQLDAINESQKQLLDQYEPFFRAILDGKKQLETSQ